MNVFFGIIWRVKLDDPIDVRDIQPSGGDVSAQQHPFSGIAKLIKGVQSFLLFLSSVYVQNWDVYVVQKVGVKLHGVTRTEEDHYFFILKLL